MLGGFVRGPIALDRTGEMDRFGWAVGGSCMEGPRAVGVKGLGFFMARREPGDVEAASNFN